MVWPRARHEVGTIEVIARGHGADPLQTIFAVAREHRKRRIEVPRLLGQGVKRLEYTPCRISD